MEREEYDRIWTNPVLVRQRLDGLAAEWPELFPPEFAAGYALHGFDRSSRKLAGVRLRKLVLADGSAYWVRPSFVLSYMAGTVDKLEFALLLLSFGVPAWVLTKGLGHSDMYWHRLLERLGRHSLVGTTVRDPERLPEHLAADEHHVKSSGEKGYIPMTTGGGCVLGVAVSDSASEEALTPAYGEFAREARELQPEYAPKTVNTDGWGGTRNAFLALFPTTALILCFLHGFLKIRDRCRKAHELHGRVWEVFRATTAVEFRQRMGELQSWAAVQKWPAAVTEMLGKLNAKTEDYAVAYDHAGCHRTSNHVDRLMNRLTRLMYAGRGLHGHQATSERRLRGWALLLNFRPFAPRGRILREHHCPAHRLSGKSYHAHWLHNLLVAGSLLGRGKRAPGIR